MNSMALLSKLLAETENSKPENDFVDDLCEPNSTFIRKSPLNEHKNTEIVATVPNSSKKSSTAIWDDEEIEEEECDSRPTPEYDIVLGQTVSSEDVFLGMSGKTPSSVCADLLTITIKLPNVKPQEIDAQVNKDHIHVTTPEFFLSTYFPKPVMNETAKAKWHPKSSTLSITCSLAKAV
eukprot:TRINITY_DN74198_c0_g3_i2.p1 TRINITY_DN74198_c0_g3~~TRINITY_DN74198_c0_g3_i2.p1  ORF type:complete len:179 (-),score=43.37 TRINITY_DN74198_c0_g3_i2:238-774(-)